MDTTRDVDLVPFRDWCRANNIGISTAYRLVAEGRLRITKLNKRSYMTRADRLAFLESLRAA